MQITGWGKIKQERTLYKKAAFLAALLLSFLPAFAYEDCLITTNGKLTDIKIEQNDVVDVYPIFTIMNDKNTLYVQALKEGKTRICVLKNEKDIVVFDVEIKPDETIIDEVDGFDILPVDEPPEDYEYNLDEPPVVKIEEAS